MMPNYKVQSIKILYLLQTHTKSSYYNNNNMLKNPFGYAEQFHVEIFYSLYGIILILIIIIIIIIIPTSFYSFIPNQLFLIFIFGKIFKKFLMFCFLIIIILCAFKKKNTKIIIEYNNNQH